MVDRLLNRLLARLRYALANLPVLPLIALLLVLGATLTHLFRLPAHEAAIEEAERRAASLERSTRRAALERQVDRVSPDDTRQRLLERFPDEQQLNGELGRIIEMAGQEGLLVPTGEYRLVPGKDGLFDRYVLSLPVKGSHAVIRRYVASVRKQFPDIAVEDISLRRENIGSTELEAQLRFVIFRRSRTT
ncbi:MAG: hypothetical protein H6R14_2469 [Proteobacteria bacterium]|nr:hypothetical protein [Pseudomonadota bacterium]